MTDVNAEAPLTTKVVRSAELFLYQEAELLDNGEYDDWLRLWEPDALYWIPISASAEYTRGRTVSIIRDDWERLQERVRRLTSGSAFSQEPASRVLHVIGNITARSHRADGASGRTEVLVASNQIVDEVRKGNQELYGARVTHRLRMKTDERWRLVEKVVRLTRSQSPLGNLTFIL